MGRLAPKAMGGGAGYGDPRHDGAGRESGSFAAAAAAGALTVASPARSLASRRSRRFPGIQCITARLLLPRGALLSIRMDRHEPVARRHEQRLARRVPRDRPELQRGRLFGEHPHHRQRRPVSREQADCRRLVLGREQREVGPRVRPRSGEGDGVRALEPRRREDELAVTMAHDRAGVAHREGVGVPGDGEASARFGADGDAERPDAGGQPTVVERVDHGLVVDVEEDGHVSFAVVRHRQHRGEIDPAHPVLAVGDAIEAAVVRHDEEDALAFVRRPRDVHRLLRAGLFAEREAQVDRSVGRVLQDDDVAGRRPERNAMGSLALHRDAVDWQHHGDERVDQGVPRAGLEAQDACAAGVDEAGGARQGGDGGVACPEPVQGPVEVGDGLLGAHGGAVRGARMEGRQQVARV